MMKLSRKLLALIGACGVVIAIAVAVTVALLRGSQSNVSEQFQFAGLSPPSDTPLGKYSSAAISCDAIYCSDIAKGILKEGGSVADAAIGALLCMGVIHSHSLGLGGGFLLVIYNATTGESRSLNARETAPAAAYKEMYEEHPQNSTMGGLAVAVPGEMKGYWELHKAHGRLPWSRLFQPTIDLCNNGFNVTRSAAAAMTDREKNIKSEPSLAEIYINPTTGNIWKEGDVMTRKALAETLKILAEKGGDALYSGTLADKLIRDLESFGSIITKSDLENYNAEWEEVIDLEIHGGYRIKTIPPPGSGILLSFILSVLSGHLLTPTSMEEYVTAYQRITETFKYTFAKRSILGDPFDEEISTIVRNLTQLLQSEEYAAEIRNSLMDTHTNDTADYYGAEFDNLQEDHGTSHLSIIAENGDAISVTSTINTYFGAKIRSRSTGIIFNNEMDDFSSPNATNNYGLPPSVNNFIKPGKRPMSSQCPAIFVDSNGRVRLVVGAAGGTRITTSTALVSIHNLWFGMNVKQALDERRLHHQLLPMEIFYENKFSEEILNTLESYGHNITANSGRVAVASAVERVKDGTLQASFDFRKSGSIAGY